MNPREGRRADVRCCRAHGYRHLHRRSDGGGFAVQRQVRPRSCCQWDSPPGQFTDTMGQKHAIAMISGETTVASQAEWPKILTFELVVEIFTQDIRQDIRVESVPRRERASLWWALAARPAQIVAVPSCASSSFAPQPYPNRLLFGKPRGGSRPASARWAIHSFSSCLPTVKARPEESVQLRPSASAKTLASATPPSL